MTLHDGQEFNDDLRGWAEENLTLSALLRVDDVVQRIAEDRCANHGYCKEKKKRRSAMSVAQEARFKAGRTCFEGASKDGGERVKALRRRDGERRGRAAACDLLTIEVGGARSVYGRSNYTVLTCDSRFPSSRPRTQALHIVKDSVKTAKSRKQNGSCQDEDNQEGFSRSH